METIDGVTVMYNEIASKAGIEIVARRLLPDNYEVIIGTHVFDEKDKQQAIEDAVYLVNKKYYEALPNHKLI